MKSRILTFFLCLVLALCMTACGSGETSAAPEQSAPPAAENAAPETAPAASADTAADEIDSEDVADGLSIIDNELCAVTAIEFADSGYDSYMIFRLENRSTDKNYTFVVQDIAVNGVTADAMGGEVVAPGETVDSKYYINFEYVDADDIGGFRDVWMNFRVRDNDDLSADDIAAVEVNMYLYGEENAVRYEREPQPGDVVLIDTGDVSVVMTGMNDGGLLGGCGVELYLVNGTDKDLTFSAGDVSVNGYMADPFWADSIGAGQVGFSEMTWLSSTLEENGITEVEEIELRLRAYDSNDWLAGDIFSDVVTITPQK